MWKSDLTDKIKCCFYQAEVVSTRPLLDKNRGSQEYTAYEFGHTSPVVSRVSGSSNLDSFRDGWLVAVQLLLCDVLPPGLIQYCLQHSCVIDVKLFLCTFS